MNILTAVVADANSPINVWLNEHPAALGGIAIAIGLALAYFGVVGLRDGKTTGKWGYQVEGGSAVALSGVRLIGGLAAIGFGIYKLFS
ncbi:MAG: hypothetical protein KDA66_18755 [Planctomycetaceae bacterium]|nr:hypothetical protein [Planctomycetaceae bacterium]